MVHTMRASLIAVYVLASFFFLTSSVFAHAPASTQTLATTTSSTIVIPSQQIPKGLTSCSDVYRFGSATVSLAPSLSEVAQGAMVAFTGTIQNQNNYPIDDVTLCITVIPTQSYSTAHRALY